MISFKGSTNGGEESFHFPRLLTFAVTLRKQKRFYDDLHTTCTGPTIIDLTVDGAQKLGRTKSIKQIPRDASSVIYEVTS